MTTSAAPLRRARERRGRLVLVLCGVAAIIAAILGITNGPLAISLGELGRIAANLVGLPVEPVSEVKSGVVLNLRVPRALLGLFVGAALGISGAIMQGMFRNPLADPGLIGVSAGGAFAAVAVIVLGGASLAPVAGALGPYVMPMAAFAGSLFVVWLIYQVSSVDGRVVVATMLLAGVAANALAFSGIGYLTFLADDTQLRDLTFWTLGSLGGGTWVRVIPACALMLIAILFQLRLARAMNCLLLGEGEAASLGIQVERVKRQAAFFTALGVGAATAVCGIVSFIGLVVPHLVRLMTGPDHRYVLPGSALLGGALVLVADLIARMSVSPAELPLGVVTAALGAPFFFWLLIKDKKRGALG
ncbi:MAG: iron ABC transporter permease [Pseudomonadota bacterium]